MGWQETVGKAAHEAWKRWRIDGGYPGHAFMGMWKPDNTRYARESFGCRLCSQLEPRHHDDMIDWDHLPPEKREKYIVQGMAGYEAASAEYRAAIRETLAALREFGPEGAIDIAVDAWAHNRIDQDGLFLTEERIARALGALDALAGEEAT